MKYFKDIIENMRTRIGLKPKKPGLILFVLLSAACLQCVSFSAENPEYADLRREAEHKLGELRSTALRAQRKGIDIEREFVTMTTAELFLKAAEWDRAHPDELAEIIKGSWWRAAKEAPRLAKELPAKQLRELIAALDAAQQELNDVLGRRIRRQPSLVIDMTALEEKEGYYHQNGRPVFPSEFCAKPDDEDFNRAFGHIGNIYISLSNLKGDGQEPVFHGKPEEDEILGNIFMGQGGVPGWLKKKYPEITDGKHHFTGFDTDHPAARQAWADILAGLVPQFAGRMVSQAGYLLTNEPHWYTCTSCWGSGPVSERTKEKFRAWLENRHGTIGALNTLWKADFSSFADVTLEVPIDDALRGKPIWYDWCWFNMDRITDWFGFLKRQVTQHDPDAKIQIKLVPGIFSGSCRCHGLDFETLVRMQEIIGCDASVMNTTQGGKKEDWMDRYACNWRDQTMPLDFFRSISPDKIVFDSEWHGLSKQNIRDPHMPPEYVRCALWLAHLHGTGLNNTWYWGRTKDGAVSKKFQGGFYASALMQPRVLDAFGRTMKELNAFAPQVVALAKQPKRIRIFYSESSAIQGGDYMEQIFETYRSLYHGGMPIGFVTRTLLEQADERELQQWPMMIVPYADHVTIGEQQALERYMARGGRLLVLGNECLLQDEYGRPLPPLDAKAGRLLRLAEADGDTLLAHLEKAGIAPAIQLTETNEAGQPGCVWRTVSSSNGHGLLILNLGRSNAKIRLQSVSGCRDLITGKVHPSDFEMEPFDVKLLALSTGR